MTLKIEIKYEIFISGIGKLLQSLTSVTCAHYLKTNK